MNFIVLVVVGLVLGLGASLAAPPDVVAVVSASSPVTHLKTTQLVDIFLGKASRFPDGSPALPIDQVEGSEVRDEFYARYADQSPAQMKARWSKIIFTGRGRPPRSVANSVEAKKLIAGNPVAIGYIERSLVDDKVRVLTLQ